MNLRLILFIPLLLVSCSDLTPTDQEEPAAASPPKPKVPEKKAAPIPPLPEPTPEPSPATTLGPVPDGPLNPLGFLDPDTTDELMTDAKKKTVSSAQANLPPPPKVEGDDAIDVDPPKLPELKD